MLARKPTTLLEEAKPSIPNGSKNRRNSNGDGIVKLICARPLPFIFFQVDSTTKIGEYDGETQGAIRKIMFDQQQKSLGLPTSDELNADALLEKAKGLPGSPFLPGGIMFEGDDGAGGGDRLAPDSGDRDRPNP